MNVSRDRSPSASGGTSRAQTPQDFAIGVSVGRRTAAFVFAFIPSLFTPFSSAVGPGAVQQADRVASGIIDDYSIEGRPNWLNESFEDEIMVGSSPESESKLIQNRYGLPRFNNVNVTIRQVKDLDGDGKKDVVARAGEPFNNRSVASVTRIVVIANNTSPSPGAGFNFDKCAPATQVEIGGTIQPLDSVPIDQGKVCEMIVRVW